MPDVIIGIDPGPHTGIATLLVTVPEGPKAEPGYNWVIGNVMTLETGEGLIPFYKYLSGILVKPIGGGWYPQRIVCEKFQTFSGMVAAQTEAQLTQQIIGFIEGTCAVYGIPYSAQAPVLRKPFEAMAKQHWPKELHRPSPHDIAALSHALKFLFTFYSHAG